MPSRPDTDAAADPHARLHQLIEHTSSLFRAGLRQLAAKEGLKLVQLEALVYLSTANRYSDTAAGLTDYLGVTKGTVSQTLLALVGRELITRAQDEHDARVQHCRLTAAGRRIVQKAYPADLIEALPDDDAARYAAGLEGLLRGLQRAAGSRSFGRCASCAHFETEPRGHRCGLTGERLTKRDALRICREHTSA